MSQLRQHLKYTFKHKIRAFFLRFKLGLLGEQVYIDKNVSFMRYSKNIFIDDLVVLKEGAKICPCNVKALIKIGKRTTIGYNTYLFASEGIFIGEDCLIAPFVYFVDSNHKIAKNKKINEQENETKKIIVGNDVWIGSSVTILKGVIINDCAVIAANSVINTNVPAYEIWGGSPAKKIGDRT